jgi:hypothetical protein
LYGIWWIIDRRTEVAEFNRKESDSGSRGQESKSRDKM